MIAAVEAACAQLGRTDDLHIERFTAAGDVDESLGHGKAFEVELARSRVTPAVAEQQRLIDAVRTVLPTMSYDCERATVVPVRPPCWAAFDHATRCSAPPSVPPATR